MTIIPEAGFITAGNYPDDDPTGGLRAQLDLFAWGEQLGYDTAGVRQRHLEHGVSSAATFLAAATQRTERITLESDVFPLGFESPFRAAEDAATIAALAPGRFNVGISVATPHADLLKPLSAPLIDQSANRYLPAELFLEALRGTYLGEEGQTIDTPDGPQRPRIQPHIPGILDDVWYGGGSESSIRWAASQGLSLLLGNLTSAPEGIDSFREARLQQLALYTEAFVGKPENLRVAVERVIVPLDGADETSRAKYRAFAEGRHARTLQAHGPTRIFFEPDLVGFAEEIIEGLASDPVYDGRTRLRISLPYSFAPHEYRQILQDIAEKVLPHVGWAPRT